MTRWSILEHNLYLSPKWQERALARSTAATG